MPNFPHKLGAPKPNSAPPVHAEGVLERLKACRGFGDDFDRHVVACTFAAAMAELEYHPMTEALGLERSEIARIMKVMFEGCYDIDQLVPPDATPGEDAVEESDFRHLLNSNRTSGTDIEKWLLHIIPRRCQAGDHMWRSIGLFSRQELTETLMRYFGPLASKNVDNMKWKKFLYRQMCESDGFLVCKSPVCVVCPDYADCFGPEE